MAEEQILIRKLDHFIRKYYKNRLIRGAILTCALLGICFLLLISVELLAHLNPAGRTILFLFFLSAALLSLGRLVVVPLLQLLKIGKIISYEQAAGIIGEHFREIEDKLLNTLQLLSQKKTPGNDSDLLSASIDQKTNSLKVFRFNLAIDLRKNLAFLRWGLIPIMLILLLIIFSPGTISEPTRRIIHFNQVFTKPLPYRIEILNKSMTAVQQEDFDLKIKITGEEIPSEIFIKSGDYTYRMSQKPGFTFSYLFKSLQSNIPFRLNTGDYVSEEYTIRVFPKPIILNFGVMVSYPAYTKKPDERIENLGDLTVPEGTTVTWNFHTRDVSSIKLRLDKEILELKSKENQTFSHTSRILKSFTYCISPRNENTNVTDSLNYRITAIADGFPSIYLEESTDSTISSSSFIKGTLKDDYGFSKLTFNYGLFKKGDTSAIHFNSETIPIDKSLTNQVFYYVVDFVKLMPEAGLGIKYFFEIWDNDGIHGPKSAKSEMKVRSTPTLDEIQDNTGNNEKSINQDLEKSISDSRAMKKTMDDLNKKLVEQNSLSWQEKKKIEELVKKNEEIEKKVDQIKEKTSENIRNEEKYLETGDRILEKQKQLRDLMDQLLTDEMKKMIEEMKKLLNQVDKEKLADLLEKMKLSTKDLETQLDRDLELMKQIEFDRKMESMINDLRKNADRQEKLAGETEKGIKSKEELLKEQEKINERADSTGKQLDDLVKDAGKLENAPDLNDAKREHDSISRSLEKSSEGLKESNREKAAGSQKKAARQMRELAKKMEEAQEENDEDQLAEDASNVRMILENLVRLSFDQEDLLKRTVVISRNDPRFTEMIYEQKEISEKLNVVEDSLKAIAKRQIAIKPIVTREIASINQNIGVSLDALNDRNINMAVAKQQFTMTSINNLALLLNESLDKMNSQMQMNAKAKSGNKSCQKPSSKGGKMSAKTMKELQKQIGDQLKRLKDGMESAKARGNMTRQEQSGMNKEVAKLAAQQEALRNELQKYQDELGEKGVKDKGSLNDVSGEMEQIERDIVNKKITQETINRQQRIMSRLLESEKAEQTREQEEKRESTEAKNSKISNPGLNYQYNMLRKMSRDDIQLTLPELNNFYKDKVSSYIVKILH